MKHLARKFRTNPTEAEKKLWSFLRRKQLLGQKFRRQYSIGNYIVDFVCLDKRLIIELDGGQHAENTEDIKRTKTLEANGFFVLRFWNNEVLENIDGVLQTIANTAFPLPEGGDQGEGL